jgi:hypothetical protein
MQHPIVVLCMHIHDCCASATPPSPPTKRAPDNRHMPPDLLLTFAHSPSVRSNLGQRYNRSRRHAILTAALRADAFAFMIPLLH